MTRFRLGVHMKRILEVLNASEKALTTTQIIMRAENLSENSSDDEGKCMRLASALMGEKIHYTRRQPCEGKREADKLYATYSRSIKRLYDNELIASWRRLLLWRPYYYGITEKGRELLTIKS